MSYRRRFADSWGNLYKENGLERLYRKKSAEVVILGKTESTTETELDYNQNK